MEHKDFLERIAPYTLVNIGIVKHLFPNTTKKELKEQLKKGHQEQTLIVHDHQNLRCYSISRAGFKLIGIDHQPNYAPNKTEANLLCRNNQFRIGFEQSISSIEGLDIDQWITGGKFQKAPLTVRLKGNEKTLKPTSASIVSDTQGNQRLYIVHEFNDWAHFSTDLILYRAWVDRRTHLQRFHLHPDSQVRFIVFIPDYKTFFQIQTFLRNSFYKNVLFLPLNRVHYDNILNEPVFIDHKGRKRAMMN